MFGPDKMGDIAGETFDVVNLRYISNQYRKSKTKDTENTVNQSKLEVITCSWREARENACERLTIGNGFTSD